MRPFISDSRHSAFFKIDVRAATGPGNGFAQEFRKAGIVPYHHDRIVFFIARQHGLKLFELGSPGASSFANLNRSL